MASSEIKIVFTADTSRVEEKLDGLQARLVELRAEAIAIKQLRAGADHEVDAVIEEIERLEVQARLRDASHKKGQKNNALNEKDV